MISTKGRYALRVMIDIAEHQDQGYIPLKDIADRQGISKKYLEIIVKDLVKENMLIGHSGKNGGYLLARTPKEYKVGEILEVMEGTLASVACLADNNYHCERKAYCKTLPMWAEFDELTHNFFYSKSLQDLVDPS